jgi:hypothetical protein
VWGWQLLNIFMSSAERDVHRLFFTTQTTLVLTKNTHFRPSHSLYLYQVFEVFVMFEMKLFQEEGYNVTTWD